METCMNETPSVCALCCTYGRYLSMQRLTAFFWRHTYKDAKLLIFNTAPVALSVDTRKGDEWRDARGLPALQVEIVNQQLSDATGQPYRDIGTVRNDALARAKGEILCLYDDDDLFSEDHISRGVAGLLAHPKHRAWKPFKSLHSMSGGRFWEPCSNNLEASVFVWMDEVKKHGFKIGTGDENLSWFLAVKDAGLLQEEVGARATYGYQWSDPVAPHKQSGDMGNPMNFENHKKASHDFGDGKPLTGDFDVEPVLERFCAARTQLGLDGREA